MGYEVNHGSVWEPTTREQAEAAVRESYARPTIGLALLHDEYIIRTRFAFYRRVPEKRKK